MRNVKRLVAGTLTMLGIILFGCTKEKEAPLAPVLSSAPYKAFVPPTAEEAMSCRNTTFQRISTMDRPESFLRLSLPKPGPEGVARIRLQRFLLRGREGGGLHERQSVRAVEEEGGSCREIAMLLHKRVNECYCLVTPARRSASLKDQCETVARRESCKKSG